MKKSNEMGFHVLSQEECLNINGGSWIGDALRWTGRALENAWEWTVEQVAGLSELV